MRVNVIRKRRKYGKLSRWTRFDRLRVICRLDGNRYECICDCRKKKSVRADHLRSGNTRSCGCLQVECGKKYGRINGLNAKHKNTAPNSGQFKPGHASGHRLTHGHARNGGTKTYQSWMGMIARVTNPNHEHYALYKNVRITPRWMGPNGFATFLKEMGERKPGMTLGRLLDLPIPGYCRANCRWMSRLEQGAERRGRTAQMRLHMIHSLARACEKIRKRAA